MVAITQMGGIICPPVPAFYNKPQNIEDLVDDTVGRVLDLFDLDCGLVKRWGRNKNAALAAFFILISLSITKG